MHPTLDLFGAHIDLYLATIAIAAVVANRLGLWIGEHVEGIPRAKMRSMLLWLAVVAFAGARAQFVWNTWSFGTYSTHPIDVLKVWRGLHAGGGLAALVIALPFVVRGHGVSLGRFADVIFPTIPIGLAIVRIGCFLQGCCFGHASDLPWAVSFPPGSPAANFHASTGLIERGGDWSGPVHPLQLYFAGAGVVAALAARWAYDRSTYPGRVALVTAAVFCTLTALAEAIRAPYYPQLYFWGARMQFEWIAIGLAGVALLALGSAEVWHRLNVSPAPAVPAIKRAAP